MGNMKAEVIADVRELSHEQWLDLRSTGIGGSDVAAIYGESPYTSAYTLWLQKSGRVGRDKSSNEAMEWGNLLEGVVAMKFARDYQAAVVAWPVMLRSKSHPFMLANLDFLIVEPSADFPEGQITLHGLETPPDNILSILEIKTTGIVGRGSGHLWENGGIQRGYELQGLHYTSVLGLTDSVVFAALVAGRGLVSIGRLYSDEEREECIRRESAFWECVVTNSEPEIDGSESTAESITKLFPESRTGVFVEADDFVAARVNEYVKAKKRAEEAEKEMKSIRAKLELAIGEAEELRYEGETILTFKSTKDSETLDSKALKAAMPEIYKQFSKVRKGYRVLRVKGE